MFKRPKQRWWFLSARVKVATSLLTPVLASPNAWCLFLSRRLQKELQNLQRHGIDADMVRIDQWMQDFHKFRQSAVWSVQPVTWHDSTTVWIYMCVDPMGKTHPFPEPWELIRTSVICSYRWGLMGERLPLPMVQVNHRFTFLPETSAVHLWLSEFGHWRPEPRISPHYTHALSWSWSNSLSGWDASDYTSGAFVWIQWSVTNYLTFKGGTVQVVCSKWC